MIITLQTLIFFRQSLFTVIHRFLSPYFKHLSLTYNKSVDVSDDEEPDEQVFAEYNEERGVVFFPPVYAQRYAAVSDCLMDERWSGKLQKVVEFGYHDLSFIKYLKEVPGIKRILAVDLDRPLSCSSDLQGCEEYSSTRECPLDITLFQGNAADPDYRLIGCDAVIAIEMIEHMLPHDLERLVHTIFGFIKPWVVVITTPNSDFNPLFKALEKNGLRRMDHFFEWSRVQFHDWCTNIVARYPQYMVTCRGVGPGPPGTQIYGSCSQLALFISNNYNKQQDLDLNSLAVVAKAPSINCNIIEPMDSFDTLHETRTLFLQNDIESFTELIFSNEQSRMTIVLSPSFSNESLEYCDKTSQCNLDSEVGKSFLMFDENLCFNMVVPRRRQENRVYTIGDLNSRLNCTTMQVNKFSKMSQNLLAKNKSDSVVHTKQVVEEIRQLRKMLNFSNETQEQPEKHIWNNINWGTNAPYWNQFYQIVKQYSFPLETKSEECRILDLITDEINRLVDTQYDEDFSTDANRLEIPIEHLLRVVQHITDDVDRVKDLLEWNGYEVAGDMVIHSRLQIDAPPIRDDDWPDDTVSDWDTDVRSTSHSDGTTIGTDRHVLSSPGRCLYRAIDQKVRELRSLVESDEDIATELDKVTCRLMKMSLKTARRRKRSLPIKWMQCKLLDLLTLTEKSIQKKRQRVKAAPCFATCYGNDSVKDELDFEKFKNVQEDDTANKIFRKYRHLVNSDRTSFLDTVIDSTSNQNTLDEDLTKDFPFDTSSNDLNPENLARSPSLFEPVATDHAYQMYFYKSDTQESSTKACTDEENDRVEYHDRLIESGDTESTPNKLRIKNKKTHRKCKKNVYRNDKYFVFKRGKKDHSKYLDRRNRRKNIYKCKNKLKATPSSVQTSLKRSLLFKIGKKNMHSSRPDNIYNPRKIMRRQSTRSISRVVLEKPLVTANIDVANKIAPELLKSSDSYTVFESCEYNSTSNIADTKESLLLDIITEENEETVALRRTIATEAADDVVFEQETVLGSMTNVMKIDSFCNNHLKMENVQSQTIFIYDINEPSTSKGVRHVSMDAQCGPDNTKKFAMLSATTSFTKLPKIFNTGLKISEHLNNDFRNNDFGTSTIDIHNDFCKTLSPRVRSVGIKIKDSVTIACNAQSENTMQNVGSTSKIPITLNQSNLTTETTMLKPVSSRTKVDDSGSEPCESLTSSRKSHFNFSSLSKNTSDFQIKSPCERSEMGVDKSLSRKYIRPKLCCGGVYIHSFRDRQVNEDVVYQGEWQKYNPKLTTKRKSPINITPKNVQELSRKKSGTKFKSSLIKNRDTQPISIKRLATQETKQTYAIKENKFKLTPEQDKKYPITKKLPRATKRNNNTTNQNGAKFVTKILVKNNSIKPSYVSKKPSVTFCNVREDDKSKVRRKSYIPQYLRRKIKKDNMIKLECNSSERTVVFNKDNTLSRNFEIAPNEIKANFLEFDLEPRDVNYVVFRNEIEANKNNSTDCESPLSIKENTTTECKISDFNKCSPSQSLYSSTGSSPNSIATVKVRPTNKCMSDKKHSTSSNKSNLSNTQIERTSKTKKYTKRSKIAKKQHLDNKENLPETSKLLQDLETKSKSFFLKNKNVFRSHLGSSPQTTNDTMSRNTLQILNKSNNKISFPNSNDKHSVSDSSSGPSVPKQRVAKSRTSLTKDSECTKKSVYSDDAASLKLQQSHTIVLPESHTKIDNTWLTDWMNNTYNNEANSSTSNLTETMRQLIEERLEIIDPIVDSGNLVDCDPEFLNNTILQSLASSPADSFNQSIPSINSSNEAVETNYNYCSESIESDTGIFNSLTRDRESLKNESATTLSNDESKVTDLEYVPFECKTPSSMLSEYCLAESSFTGNPELGQVDISYATAASVRDLFERKPTLQFQNPLGNLAAQAFSGFSMNVEPVAGDQPDRINLVDSETGSFAVEFARQTTSEEVFVSGRSSESFESCLIGDDTEVPQWLFQIISQQQAEEDEDEEEDEDTIPLQLPVVEPILDMNGNEIEPTMGASAGAGDGRGIHSDHSQDSSGRGTSLSSSASSSGPQSEAIIIDPSAFMAQYELMRESGSSSIVLQRPPIPIVMTDASHVTHTTADVTEHNRDVLNSSGDPQRTAASLGASDVDADVSSIDTDFPDSSDD